ncbi:DUF2840 domain-containing protein [Pelagibacterium halotolerans]|uniref:Glycosidase n=1 Tax=Pelagibacterium halotolerans (strain DSM 22347 / JCM 15775 / CGMCC 1.7692 / B2) TaxID=1082931 RepID=G4RAV0_PELHB|nr:DUF2840 domain-containing protein [Pelagibacterium halotolerans]AEQ53586.1 hypothetical protein KKY_3602 [Pelagibacterium halotolerans B2]QJR20240.1 DUF2840 domain-containing protein [Pelagibacterium halotolerans]SEA56897.1 Protein of unknown function [Pelagibacterium halotolerans]
MSGGATVELVWIEKRVEHWIRFGRIARTKVLSRSRSTAAFDPGAVFAFVRWQANDYGTVVSRIDILRAPRPGEPYATVPYVTPGGESLLRLSGWPKVERVLQVVDAIEALGVNPANAAPNYWRHVHNRLSAGMEPRGYTAAQHRAWLLRQTCPPDPQTLRAASAGSAS